MTADSIHVEMDEEFTVSLKSIATAGYLWKIESLPDAIQLLGTQNEQPPREMKPGDATERVFRFRALKPGEHQISFMLARPWENTAIESKTVTVKVSSSR